MTFLPTIAFARIGDTLCLCYVDRKGPSDADWGAWLARLRTPDFDKLLLSSTSETGPNSKQRRLVADLWKSSGRAMPRAAKLTSSPVTRGALTALSWLLPNLPMRAFSPEDLTGALHWLGTSVSPSEVSALLLDLATGDGDEQKRAS